MKKRGIKNLNLNKKTIVFLKSAAEILGGTGSWGSAYCTMPTMQCPSLTGGSCKETQYKCPVEAPADENVQG
jgi:hypothetical protein